jgi:hypothetical protein
VKVLSYLLDLAVRRAVERAMKQQDVVGRLKNIEKRLEFLERRHLRSVMR